MEEKHIEKSMYIHNSANTLKDEIHTSNLIYNYLYLSHNCGAKLALISIKLSTPTEVKICKCQ